MKLWILIGDWQFTLRLPDPMPLLRELRSAVQRGYKPTSLKV
jgi:hypothetical protein